MRELIKTNIKMIGIIEAVILAAVVLVVFMIQGSQNKAIALEESVETARSDIDTQLQRRVNVLTELAECVKQYDKHEYETIVGAIKERGSSAESADDVISQINAVAEAYPELASQANYKELMEEISITENLLAQHKKAYNSSIKAYNRYVRKFPARIFLGWTGYEAREFEYYKTDATDTAPMKLFGEE